MQQICGCYNLQSIFFFFFFYHIKKTDFCCWCCSYCPFQYLNTSCLFQCSHPDLFTSNINRIYTWQVLLIQNRLPFMKEQQYRAAEIHLPIPLRWVEKPPGLQVSLNFAFHDDDFSEFAKHFNHQRRNQSKVICNAMS